MKRNEIQIDFSKGSSINDVTVLDSTLKTSIKNRPNWSHNLDTLAKCWNLYCYMTFLDVSLSLSLWINPLFSFHCDVRHVTTTFYPNIARKICENMLLEQCCRIFNEFVNVIFGNLFFGRLCYERYFFSKLTQKNPKMFQFSFKKGLLKLPPIAKVMEKQKFKWVYLRTMILCLQTY